ncbi:gephyrin-like molybdotransferase receptor GlpR [Amycolatopsis benzoatilytica]|uniref:divisome protein SepX/GlpR n=1 Tax=Amycolatopsis benzoatilytica TaxID=346045 RepID=UPI00036D0D02|nr:gephyrin-like molybdotransferase receptor GlpR [Amycolatopsis benzoatilytica]
MPSSVIIVALAAAWLVVLVPMVARKRQQVARTPTSALAARVVRRGSARNEGQEDDAVSDNAKPSVEDDLAELEAELDADLDEEPEPEPEPLPQPSRAERGEPARERRSYRPGRGGFDPEAAEIAARAKYAFRQRVVVILLIAAVGTAAIAGFVFTLAWWAHAAADIALVGYLGYLRRQVRIENDIRQRRMSRYSTTSRPARRAAPVREEEYDSFAEAEDEDVEVVAPEVPREIVERKPSPMSRIRRQAVVVDLDDEDPAFEELAEPSAGPYRRAVGE